jgi:hypothetical protein
MALFAGDDTREAMVAAMRFDRFVEAAIRVLERVAKRST